VPAILASVILVACGFSGVTLADAAPSHRLYLGACRQADGSTPAMTYCGCSYDHLAAARVRPALVEARAACQNSLPPTPYPLGLTLLPSLHHPAVPAGGATSHAHTHGAASRAHTHKTISA
jgi:hypothetical protein